ncbi:hypothetical protein [Psychrobacter sp. S4(2024)]|uniref:hypothetical protein n=1 Tax=Psychrobacter sp. S4(2024) TaxID=3111913 RepID=UPI002FE3475F
MKIKYIKDAPNGPAGMLDEVTEFEGNVLVLTGFAEVDDGTDPEPPLDPNLFVVPPTEPKPKTKLKAKATTKTDSE